MAGLTKDGIEIKRFRDLVLDTQESLDKSSSGLIITDTSNKVVNNLVNPLLLAIAEVYELSEQVWNSFDLDSANGVSLDRLGQFKDVVRKGDTYSTGKVEFSQTGNSAVNTTTKVRTGEGIDLVSMESRTLNTNLVNSFEIDFSSTTMVVGVEYFVRLDGEKYSYVSTSSDTLDSVYLNLATQISLNSAYSAIKTGQTLKVTSSDNFTLSKRSDMTISLFSTLVNFRTTMTGDIIVIANTATALTTFVSGNTSVTNPDNFSRGTSLENDEEYRTRIKNTSSVNGYATQDAILKAVSNVTGVNSVSLAVNNSIYTNVEGVPPKAYETIVFGGEDQDIADEIFRVGGAGIEYFGNVTREVTGIKGGLYPVSFTRPTNIYLFLEVQYEKYEEFQEFPVNGEELIIAALVSTVEDYTVGQDVIPSKLNNTIYTNVSGVGEVRIKVSYNTEPDEGPLTPYYEDRVRVSTREVPVLTTDRVKVFETNIT